MTDLIIGWSMLVASFGALFGRLFCLIIKELGIKETLQMIGAIVGVVAGVVIAAYFLFK